MIIRKAAWEIKREERKGFSVFSPTRKSSCNFSLLILQQKQPLIFINSFLYVEIEFANGEEVLNSDFQLRKWSKWRKEIFRVTLIIFGSSRIKLNIQLYLNSNDNQMNLKSGIDFFEIHVWIVGLWVQNLIYQPERWS